MTALFWKPGSAPQFGAFHHDLGFGLMHLADAAQLPGKKVWTYGHGPHRCWGQATTQGGASYCEMEGGPLLDQSEKALFPAGTDRRFEEYWVPVHSREACDRVDWPQWILPPMTDAWLGWQHSSWQTEWEKFRCGDGPLPTSTVVTGIDLETGLHRALERGNENAAEPLALWLAFRGRAPEALSALAAITTPEARRIAGLIQWKALKQPEPAVAHLEAGPLHDPIAVAELDELYAELGQTAKRSELLARPAFHRLVVERRAALALAAGDAQETLNLLAETPWPREHQRYVRTGLWKAAKAALGEADAEVPDLLHEDNLARFGAYWSDS
jgi:hypothetical protein